MKRVAIIFSILISTALLCAQKKNVGIALSGGGALGFAHIGVLQALEDHGIKPEVVSGTSMGALVGAMYANGLSPQEIFEMVKVEELHKLNSFTQISLKNIRTLHGVSSQEKLRHILTKYLPHNSFDSLQLPLYVSVSNLTDGRGEIVHSGGNLVAYLQGSSCIPGFFSPTVIGGKLYVDGGIYNNLPAQVIRDECRVLIAVDVNSAEYRKPVVDMGDVMSRSLSLLIYENTHAGRAAADYVINVPVNSDYGQIDFAEFYNIYQIGYRTGLEYINSHPELLKYGD